MRGRGKCKSGWLKKEIPKLRTVAIFILERVLWIEREIRSGRRRRRRTDPTVLGERNHQLQGEKSKGGAIAIDSEVNIL